MNDLVSALSNAVPPQYRPWLIVAALAFPYLTRSLHALATGRGIKGAISGVFFGTNTPAGASQQQALPIKINVQILLATLGLAAFMVGCASLDTNVFNGENTTADGISAARHTFNVWYSQEKQTAVADNNTNRVAELNAMRDYVRQQVYRAGVALKTVDSIRLEVRSNPAQTNLTALQIAADALPLAQSNLTWAVKFFMSGRLSAAVRANP